jgi:hypothetical protein
MLETPSEPAAAMDALVRNLRRVNTDATPSGSATASGEPRTGRRV